jgi:hypothetical protein
MIACSVNPLQLVVAGTFYEEVGARTLDYLTKKKNSPATLSYMQNLIPYHILY